MQEFIFRGKLKKDDYNMKAGDWFESTGLIHQTDFYGTPCDRYFIVDGGDTLDYDIGEPYEVEPDTVGQFIGRFDINGKRIFTGDIVRIVAHSHMPVYDKPLIVDWFDDYGLGLCGLSGHRWRESILTFTKCEVIGNKWDNPELMEV